MTRQYGFRRNGLLTGAVAVLLMLVAGIVAYEFFSTAMTDRSGPVLLKSIQNLSRYEAATGNFEVVVDLEKSGGGPFGFLTKDRVLLVVVGSVDVYVDFSKISDGAIAVSSDRQTVTFTLPPPELERPNLDHVKTHVYDETKGVFTALRDVFGDDNAMVDRAYQSGEAKLAQAAEDAGLQQVAEDNTRRMLTGMMGALGFSTTTVTFTAPAR